MGFLAWRQARPVLAHQTEIAADIGATLHIEPNDIPRAGEESLAWFALTQRGGEIVPLSSCDCMLMLYSLPGNELLAEPALEAVSAEGYESIPGAMVEFPQVGAYELVLQGTPMTDGDFQPFEFRFEVTVATGTSNSSQNADVSASTTSEDAASGESGSGESLTDRDSLTSSDTLTSNEPEASSLPEPVVSSQPNLVSPFTLATAVIVALLIAGIARVLQSSRRNQPQDATSNESSKD